MSGGVVYVTNEDGILRLLNADTGQLIASIVVGGQMAIQAAIAADANG